MGKFGCCPHFLSILWVVHTDMSARVVQGGEMSRSFGVNTGVKQGCVLTQIFSTSSVWQWLSSSITTSLLQMALPSSTGSMVASVISAICKYRRLQLIAYWLNAYTALSHRILESQTKPFTPEENSPGNRIPVICINWLFA